MKNNALVDLNVIGLISLGLSESIREVTDDKVFTLGYDDETSRVYLIGDTTTIVGMKNDVPKVSSIYEGVHRMYLNDIEWNRIKNIVERRV